MGIILKKTNKKIENLAIDAKVNKILASNGSPIYDAGLKIKSNGACYEEKNHRFRCKFLCPNLKAGCLLRKSEYGCTKFLQKTILVLGKLESFQEKFTMLYPKRQSVERVHAYLISNGLDFP